jgi:hypothetical protein
MGRERENVWGKEKGSLSYQQAKMISDVRGV